MPDDTLRWQWDARVNRFRDTMTGRFISADRAISLRDRFVASRADRMADFVRSIVSEVDRTDATAWQTAVNTVRSLGWRRVENTMIAEYMYGRGGIKAMTATDQAMLRTLLHNQKRYWNAFMREAVNDPEKMTDAYMANRAMAYHHASRSFFERGRASAWAIRLPTYPGEQQCLGNCHCHWAIVDRSDRVEATWTLGASDHCADCSGNAVRYAPYVILKPEEEAA